VTGVTRFGQVKVGPQLAAVLGKAFNLNPKVFLQKGFNLSGNFENLRQYLLKNAQEDFSNLPEAYDPSISGKNRVSGAAFIPENVKREFYKKVEGTNRFELDKSKTVKDYINLLKESDGRSTGAQTVKGLSDLHFRNKIAETLIEPSTRRVTGIKFSKRFSTEAAIEADTKLNNLFIEAAQAKDINAIAASLGLPKITVNDSNREAKQTKRNA